MSIADNIAAVQARIRDACARAGRDAADVTLIAVSKTKPLQMVREAAAAGQHQFGENRADALVERTEALPDEHFHFIGNLQTNKVRLVVGRTPLIHSVDSWHLLQKINARAGFLGLVQPVLLEVNISGEESKSGFASDDVAGIVSDAAAQCANVQVNGLMTMAPFVGTDDAEQLRWIFAGLRELAERLRARTGCALPQLSMGMSGDYEVAVEEGATLVRVGTAIFGTRN
ncbi:MAG: YggS family pyridoxal phosphate-dependent enzyme [Actinomycetes bacterium]|nr:YggS family pyridoxal phosphate-dependent enzyme [Actinomycetes bacterium]